MFHFSLRGTTKRPLPLSGLFGLTLLVLLLGVGVGWLVKPQTSQTQVSSRKCLRLSGYQFIQPLLTCDIAPLSNSPQFADLKNDVQHLIDNAKKDGSVTEVSVYLRDVVNRQEMNINPNEKFFPASLKKVPLMMAYYKESEANPGFLQEPVTITDRTDYNEDTTIRPKEVPLFGSTYTTAELINYMITYSDNISFQVLLKKLGTEKFNKAYLDLQLNYPDNVVLIDDYITPYQFSLFFRTLFNATYLNQADSEAALSLLSNVDYKNGLIAGVPDSVKVAHKFGIGVVEQPDGSQQGELHDCGVVYRADQPYLLCVMSKSKSPDITKVEKTISGISSLVYQYAENNYQKK